MANTRSRTRRTSGYRGGSSRTSGPSAVLDTVKSTLGRVTGGGRKRSGGGGLAAQASGFIGGLLGSDDRNRGRGRGRRRR